MVRWRWVGSTFVFRMIWMNCLKIKETCGAYSKATYTHVEFKRDVLAHLQKKFDSSVKPGNKAVEVEASGSRRSADVLVAIQFRSYHRFISLDNQEYDLGICFYNGVGT